MSARRTSRLLPAALAAVVALAALAGLRAWRGTSPAIRLPRDLAPSELSLLLITLDTTRADRIGCYGARDAETPNLDRLAARGVVFETAIAVTPLTLPAHATIFTSLLPGAHSVRDNGGFRLAPQRTTLAEALGERGWRTGGFVSAYVLDRKWGIGQGFERYFDDFDLQKFKSPSMGDIQRRGDETAEAALDWIRRTLPGKFFAWVHLYDPHAPYDPPEPYAARHAGRPYNGEIAWTDALVGRLLEALERSGAAGRTIVAVVGDHGESFGEHGESGHGFFVYEPSLRVPFILAAPHEGLAGRRVAEVVRQVDVAPTLLDLVGLAGALPEARGRSLVPLMAEGRLAQDAAEGTAVAGVRRGVPEQGGAPPAWSESFYPRFHFGWSELRSVHHGRWHFIEAPRPELYDVAADPGETTNLAGAHPDVVSALRAALEEIETETVPLEGGSAPLEEDEETLRKLAALGYAGGAAAAGDASWRNLPDPKDRIRVYDLVNRAREEVQADRGVDALRLLDEILVEDPEVIDAWFMKGNVHFRKRDWEKAAEFYRRTLEKRPDHDYAMIGLADTLQALGRVDDALVGYRRFLERDPDNAQITYRLAQALLDDGRDAEAAEWFRRTQTIEPIAARAEVGLAVVAFRQGRTAESRGAIGRALALDPKARYAHYNLALILEAEGDGRGAADQYRAEIAEHSSAWKAHFNLGRLLERMGDQRGAVDSLRRSVVENPDFAGGRLFLARALMDAGDLDGAADEARRGLRQEPESELASLGHYVLADVYNRQGRHAEAGAELKKGKRLEARPKSPRRKPPVDLSD